MPPRSLIWILPLVVLLLAAGGATVDPLEEEEGPLEHVVAVVKGKAELPCDISAPIDGDQASLVLWYKDDASPSIYTYDSRDRLAAHPRHWSDENLLGRRAFFRTLGGSGAALVIDGTRELDAGLYRCRVDFKKSPTRNSRVNLTVIVPPKQMRIVDEKGRDVDDVVGPYDEESTLELICIVTGGNPQPEVTWWQEQRLIDRQSEVRTGEAVSNTLRLERLGRPDLRSTISCQASNTQLTLPVAKTVLVDLNLRPLEVRILSSRQPLSANKRYEVTCQAVGSRPSATVTWWKDGVLLRRAQETLFDGGNVTLSQLTLQLTPDDDGRRLVCRAENPALGPSSALEDSWILDVYYAPQVRLELGRNLESENIREGTDVYFDCIVIARPNNVRITWRHEGVLLQHNVSSGIIISESSLVLQRVSRTSSGRYTCHAINSEGEASSQSFQLRVLHKPICSRHQRSSYGAAKGHAAEITCQVDSKPSATHFRWAFNGSGDVVDIPSNFRTTADGSTSILRYTPRTELDFGTVLCWASNPMGQQAEPCVFHVYAAGYPDPPTNCSISNQTAASLEIDCGEGFDGGIPQHFKLQVYDIKTNTLLANLSSSSPRFALYLNSASGRSVATQDDSPRTHSWKSNTSPEENHLRPGGGNGDGEYSSSVAVIPAVGTLLKVTAVNARGVSDAVFLEANWFLNGLPAEQQTGQVSSFELTPTVGILIGIVATGVVLIVGIIVGLRLHCGRKRRQTRDDLNRELGKDYLELASKDPDLIQDKDIMPHITDNPLDFLSSSVVGIRPGDCPSRSSGISTIPPGEHCSSIRSSQEEVVYAELALARMTFNNQQQSKQQQLQQQQMTMPGDSIVYAQIDHSRKSRNKLNEANFKLPDLQHIDNIRETALT